MPLNEPHAVEVRVDGEGVPAVVAPASARGSRPAPGRSGRGSRVEAVRETWRIDDEWWRKPVSRLYHDLVLEGGARVIVYQDLEAGGWYLHA